MTLTSDVGVDEQLPELQSTGILIGGTIQQRFEQFHRLNPWVLTTLIALTEEVASRGVKRIGIRMLWEQMRWRYLMSTRDPNSIRKLNDHYHSRYVRMICDERPDLAHLFELRKLQAA